MLQIFMFIIFIKEIYEYVCVRELRYLSRCNDRLRPGRLGFDSRQRIFSYPQRPDRLWGPPSLQSNEYPGFFLRG
jgi:hypothetical protein